MQSIPNPYGEELGTRDPLEALADTPERIHELLRGWTAEQFERSYAPGKWSARQILIHLAQTELALTARARFALTADNHAAASFSQDEWMRVDDTADGATALAAYVSLRRFNLALWRSLSPADRERPFSHPEYGRLTVWWIAAQMAGHDIRHYRQLAAIG